MIWERIPCDKWVQWGRCIRIGGEDLRDGTFLKVKLVEYFVTFRLPWKHTRYAINLDENVRGWARVIIRFKPGMTVDQPSHPQEQADADPASASR